MSQRTEQDLINAGLSPVFAALTAALFDEIRGTSNLNAQQISLLQASRPAINKVPRLKQITDQLLGRQP